MQKLVFSPLSIRSVKQKSFTNWYRVLLRSHYSTSGITTLNTILFFRTDFKILLISCKVNHDYMSELLPVCSLMSTNNNLLAVPVSDTRLHNLLLFSKILQETNFYCLVCKSFQYFSNMWHGKGGLFFNGISWISLFMVCCVWISL